MGAAASTTKAAHTPGPWAIEHARTLLRTNKQCDFGRKPIDDAEVEANARLIAAAPDLLAAAHDALKEIRRWRKTGMPDIPKFMDAEGALSAAIAKTGAT